MNKQTNNNPVSKRAEEVKKILEECTHYYAIDEYDIECSGKYIDEEELIKRICQLFPDPKPIEADEDLFKWLLDKLRQEFYTMQSINEFYDRSDLREPVERVTREIIAKTASILKAKHQKELAEAVKAERERILGILKNCAMKVSICSGYEYKYELTEECAKGREPDFIEVTIYPETELWQSLTQEQEQEQSNERN